jgi:hypothetical protein
MVELTLENDGKRKPLRWKKNGHSALLLRCCCAALHCRYVIDMTSSMASISLMSICQATITTVGYGASQWHMCIPDVSVEHVETERLKSKNFMSLFKGLKWQEDAGGNLFFHSILIWFLSRSLSTDYVKKV